MPPKGVSINISLLLLLSLLKISSSLFWTNALKLCEFAELYTIDLASATVIVLSECSTCSFEL